MGEAAKKYETCDVYICHLILTDNVGFAGTVCFNPVVIAYLFQDHNFLNEPIAATHSSLNRPEYICIAALLTMPERIR